MQPSPVLFLHSAKACKVPPHRVMEGMRIHGQRPSLWVKTVVKLTVQLARDARDEIHTNHCNRDIAMSKIVPGRFSPTLFYEHASSDTSVEYSEVSTYLRERFHCILCFDAFRLPT